MYENKTDDIPVKAVLACVDTGEFDAEVSDGIEVLFENLIAEARRGNVIAQHTACFLVFVDNCHVRAQFGEFCGDREARRTSTDAEDFFAVGGSASRTFILKVCS